MNLGKLLGEGYIRPIAKNPKLVENALKAAESDLGAAKHTLGSGNFDWALAMAYSSMLQAGVALVYSEGYCPASEGSHLAVVKFSAEIMPKESSELVRRFNQLRIRRHKVIYEERGTVTKEEVERAMARAVEFLEAVRKMLGKRR